MNTKAYVEDLLKNYHQIKHEIALLKFDMQNFKGVNYDEMIELLNFAKPEIEGRHGSGISDKTGRIALVYRDIADTTKRKAVEEICNEIIDKQAEIDRLDYCISCLDEKLANIINAIYIKKMTWAQIMNKLYISQRSIGRYRKNAIDSLAALYEFKKTSI